MKVVRDWLVFSIGLIMVVLMLWDLTFSEHGYFVFKQEKEQQAQLMVEIEALKLKKAHLNAEIIRLRDDPRALEEVIHRELGYVYPDEYMLIMPKNMQKNHGENRSEDE
ncbi:MAG: septum formation initiator family protein [Mariprofundaceae bacterium]|nr:septum formation initiator family protein [Mariprofundaceae bacterium]